MPLCNYHNVDQVQGLQSKFARPQLIALTAGCSLGTITSSFPFLSSNIKHAMALHQISDS